MSLSHQELKDCYLTYLLNENMLALLTPYFQLKGK